MSKKKVICIMGKSACGKSTVINYLCSGNNTHYIASKTTRELRVDDPNDASTHIFCTPEDFRYDLANGKIVATYVSPQNYINWTSDDLFNDDKINIYAIDPIAFISWCDWGEDIYDIYGIYIDIPEHIRQARMMKRGGVFEDEPHLSWELFCKNKLSTNKYVIVNGDDTSDNICNQIKNIIKENVGWTID